MDVNKAIELLKEQIQKIETIKNPPGFNPQYKIWKNTTKKILSETFNPEYLKMFENAGPNEIALSDRHYYNMYLKTLDEQKQLLEGFIKEHERFSTSGEKITSERLYLESYKFHAEVENVAINLFHNGHYAQAVEESFKRVIKEVKKIMQKKGESIYDGGDSLINHAFGISNQTPVIKFNNLQSIEEKDEQKGIMFLFKGIVSIRNRKAHDNVILDSSERAIEYLVFASLLMRLLELSKSYDS